MSRAARTEAAMTPGASAAAPRAQAGPAQATSQGKSVLVVDDDPGIRTFMSIALRL